MVHIKEREKIKARHMRRRGASLNKIAATLRVAKSSVSVWVRDVRLTQKQILFLSHKRHTREVIQKRVATRLKNEEGKRAKILEAHKKLFPGTRLSLENLLVLGTALYWGEGGKSSKNRSFNFTNSDPAMIRAMLVFLRNICKTPNERIRGHIHLHPHLKKRRAEKYWSLVSQIPLGQFYKTTQTASKASTNTRDTLPYGTFSIQIGSTDLFLKMLAWIEVLYERIDKAYPA